MKNAKKRKHTKVTKHAHRKAMIAEKKAKGKYSRVDLPKGFDDPIHYCLTQYCSRCWANGTHFCS